MRLFISIVAMTFLAGCSNPEPRANADASLQISAHMLEQVPGKMASLRTGLSQQDTFTALGLTGLITPPMEVWNKGTSGSGHKNTVVYALRPSFNIVLTFRNEGTPQSSLLDWKLAGDGWITLQDKGTNQLTK